MLNRPQDALWNEVGDLKRAVRDLQAMEIVRPYCVLTASSAPSIATSTWTALSWDTETKNVGGMHSTTTNPTRVTAAVPALYTMKGGVGWSAYTSGLRELEIRVNGTIRRRVRQEADSSSGQVYHEIALDWFLDVGDYAELYVWHNRGSNLSIFQNNYSPFFSVAQLA